MQTNQIVEAKANFQVMPTDLVVEVAKELPTLPLIDIIKVLAVVETKLKEKPQ